jgi:hypothetical protein
MNRSARSPGQLLRSARLRAAFNTLGLLLPWWLALRLLLTITPGATLLTGRVLHPLDALALLLLLAAATVAGWRRDRRWLARRLDACRPEFEDSAWLLFAAPGKPSPGETASAPSRLAALQRDRLQRRLAALPVAALQLGPRWRRLGGNFALAATLAIAAIAVTSQLPTPAPGDDTPASRTPSASAEPRLVERRLRIEPPAYTGLPDRDLDGLDAEVAEFSQLHWTLRVEPTPATVTLRFHDGSELPLQADDDGSWRGSRQIDAATRYRVRIGDTITAPDAAAQRIEVIADRPPQLRVTAPAQTLTLVEAADRLELVAEASDDYGLADAELSLTHAQGDGENVQVAEQRIRLVGDDRPRQRRYRQSIDLAALGFAPGDDLILRLVVSDNRAPTAQQTRSPAYILRWPRPAMADMEGFDGLVQRTLPAYFRSQRQIIIDSEALLERRAEFDDDDFVQRSDAIGIDQRLLRLRYGQFLGEESESVELALPDGHSLDDGHDHGDHADLDPADGAGQLVAEYGHSHDHSEAATLFDSATRELLRAALREMWQSELQLRLGAPALALPHQYRALDHIKQVQQAGRIYLARVGLELPPIDFSRRLSADLSAVRPRPDPLSTAVGGNQAAETLWQMLDPLTTISEERRIALDRFADWLHQHQQEVDDPLALFEALDRLRRQPDCEACAEQLRARLAPLRPTPAAAVELRRPPDRGGRRYLEALQAMPR